MLKTVMQKRLIKKRLNNRNHLFNRFVAIHPEIRVFINRHFCTSVFKTSHTCGVWDQI